MTIFDKYCVDMNVDEWHREYMPREIRGTLHYAVYAFSEVMHRVWLAIIGVFAESLGHSNDR